MYLNEIYSRVYIRKLRPLHFLFKIFWKKEMLYRHLFLTLLLCVSWGKFKKVRKKLNGTWLLIYAEDVNIEWVKD